MTGRCFSHIIHILDDEDDMGIHMSRLVRTDFDRGLTDEDVEKACRILKDGSLEENENTF